MVVEHNPTESTESTAARTVAVIDIGSSSIRMDIHQLAPDGRLELVESVRRGLLLGNDTFTDGRLSQYSIRAACDVLADFKERLEFYGVADTDYRAVATAAVREAENGDLFVDRVHLSTGMSVEVLSGADETRLTYIAVRHALLGRVEYERGLALVVEVGGGSTDMTLLRNGAIVSSTSCRLGGIRLRRMTARRTEGHEQQIAVFERIIDSVLDDQSRHFDFRHVRHLIALGGDVRFVARQCAECDDSDTFWLTPRDAFHRVCSQVVHCSREELVDRFGISSTDAQTIVPALLAYRAIVERTAATEVVVANTSLRHGVLAELIVGPEEMTEDMTRQVIASAMALARKYNADMKHARHVARLATRLYDELSAEYQMGGRERVLLETAAWLHEVGMFVSIANHERHTHHLVSHSEVFGLRREDVALVALVARYHRGAPPAAYHAEYGGLSRDERATVCKLAAILRIADALDIEHDGDLESCDVRLASGVLVIIPPRSDDWTVVEMSLQEKADLFEDVFGRRVVLREEEIS